VDDKA